MPIKSNNDKNKPLNCVDGQPKSGESMIDGLNRDGKGKKAGKSDDHVATSDASGRDFHRKGSTQHSRQSRGSDSVPHYGSWIRLLPELYKTRITVDFW